VVEFIFAIIELFQLSLTVKRKSVEVAVFRREWVTLSADFRRKGRHPPTTVGVGIAEWLPFHVVSKYPQCII